jgi:hypothetical protein
VLVAGGLEAVIAIDLLTFAFSVVTLLAVGFPTPERSDESAAASGTLRSEIAFGVGYLRKRPGLLALLGYFAVLNLVFGFVGILLFPLILGFADEQATGAVVSIGAIGMVVGSLVMSAWGGPKRRILGVIVGDGVLGVGLILIGLRPSVVVVTLAALIFFAALPIANGSSQAIWQSKVAPDVQGRVFAVRRTISQVASPLAYILAGPLLDGLFQPLMDRDGPLSGSVGMILGTGDGRGAAFFMVVLGLISVAVTGLAYSYPRLRNLEDEIPDAVADEGLGLPVET